MKLVVTTVYAGIDGNWLSHYCSSMAASDEGLPPEIGEKMPDVMEAILIGATASLVVEGGDGVRSSTVWEIINDEKGDEIEN